MGTSDIVNYIVQLGEYMGSIRRRKCPFNIIQCPVWQCNVCYDFIKTDSRCNKCAQYNMFRFVNNNNYNNNIINRR